MKSKLLILLIVASIISSCTTYKEYDETSFSNFSWESGQTITFKPIIENIEKSYRLGIGMRHIYGFSDSRIKITVTSISPSGNATMESYEFIIKDEEGEYLSSCVGDVCDLETFVTTGLQFQETGEYTFRLTYHGRNSLMGVTALGLIIDEE